MSLLSSALVILIVMIIRIALIKCGKCSLSKSESNVREQSWVQLIFSISISRPSLFDAFLTQCHLHQQSIGQNKQRLHLCKSIHNNHSKDKNKQTTTITTTTTSTIHVVPASKATTHRMILSISSPAPLPPSVLIKRTQVQCHNQ